jgi:hypothetical protein
MLKRPFVPLVYSNLDDRQAPTSQPKSLPRLIVLLLLPYLAPASPEPLSNVYQDFSTNIRAEKKVQYFEEKGCALKAPDLLTRLCLQDERTVRNTTNTVESVAGVSA